MPTIVQSVQRCMAILEVLNLRNGATVAAICAETGLTSGTVYRILETLRRDDFVQKADGSSRYWLAQRIRSLSDGYRDEWWIDGVARAIVNELGRTVRWPVKLLTPAGDHLTARITTEFASPFTARKFPTGQHVSLLWTSAGRTYLAFCSPGQREVLLQIASTAAPSALSERSPPADLDAALQTIREDGYGLVDNARNEFFSLAVPVKPPGLEPLGCLAIHVLRRAIRRPQAVSAFLPLLQAAANDIVVQYVASE